MTARARMVAELRGNIERIEAGDVAAAGRAALGHAEADAALQGGLALGAVHEVFSEGRHSTAATGFIAGLARRVRARRPLLWVRQDFWGNECGALATGGRHALRLRPPPLVRGPRPH